MSDIKIPDYNLPEILSELNCWCMRYKGNINAVYGNELSLVEKVQHLFEVVRTNVEAQIAVTEEFGKLYVEYQKLYDFVMQYFANLDVQEEINKKLDVMSKNGELSVLITPLIPPIVQDWLDKNITPTTPIIDSTLTLKGAAADSLQVGNQINQLKNSFKGIEVYTNMLNVATVKKNFYYSNNSFTQTAGAGYGLYPPIDLTGGYYYTVNGLDTDFTWIMLESGSGFNIKDSRFKLTNNASGYFEYTFFVPMNVVCKLYLTLKSTAIETDMMNAGLKIFPSFIKYQDVVVRIDSLIDKSLSVVGEASDSLQVGRQVEKLKQISDSVTVYDNLLNNSVVEKGLYYANENLAKYSNAGYAVFPGIRITGGYKYTVNGMDENFTYIKVDDDVPKKITDKIFKLVAHPKGYFEFEFYCPMGDTVLLYLTTKITAVETDMITTGDKLYKKFIPYNNTVVEIHSLNQSITNVIKIYDNLLPSEIAEKGFYYSGSTLKKVANAGYSLYNGIVLNDNTTYTINGCSKDFTFMEINGEVYPITHKQFNLKDHGSGYYEFQFSVPISSKPTIYVTSYVTNYLTDMLTTGTELYNKYIPYGQYRSNLEDQNLVRKTYLYVKPTYNESETIFKTVVGAINKANSIADKSNVVTIFIDSGSYNIFNELGGQSFVDKVMSSTSELQGLVLGDYVNISGVGDVKLNLMPDGVPIQFTQRVSLLNFWRNNVIFNIKGFVKNCRYVCHIETNNSLTESNIEIDNCYFEHTGANVVGAWTSRQAVACGTGKTGNYLFKNSFMKTDNSQGFSMHTNSNQIGNNVTFDGCVLIGAGTNVGGYVTSVGVNSLLNDNLYLKNTISKPNAFGVLKQSDVNTWNFYDFVNNTYTPA